MPAASRAARIISGVGSVSLSFMVVSRHASERGVVVVVSEVDGNELPGGAAPGADDLVDFRGARDLGELARGLAAGQQLVPERPSGAGGGGHSVASSSAA